MKSKFIFLLVINFIVISVGDDPQTAGVTSTAEKTTSSLEKGVEGLVNIVHSFLNSVQSEDFLAAKSGTFSFNDVERIIKEGKYSEVADRWRDVVAVFGGFAACVIIGLLFMLCMPVAGCINCCCFCCCKRCGKAKSKEDPKNAKCKRITFGTFLFIFAVLILVGAIFAVISNEILHSKFENVNEQGPVGQVKTAFKDLVSFADKTSDTIVTSASKNVIETVDSLIKIIKDASVATVTDIQNAINAPHLLDQVEKLGKDANQSLESLNDVTREVTFLKTLGVNTTQKLTDVKSNLTQICSGLNNSGVSCPSFSNLQLTVDFTPLDNLSSIGNVVKTVTDISSKASSARAQFEKVKTTIQDKLNSTIIDAEAKTNKLKADILKEIPKVKDTLGNMTKSLNISDSADMKSVDDALKKYGDYVWYVFIGLPCLLLLVVLFYFFGLLFGMFGERPGRGASCCNKGAGSNMLCCGVVCSYLVSSIVMLVVILMFIPLGLLYTNGCRYLNDGVENLEKFEIIVNSSFGYNVAEYIDPNKKSPNITVGSILRGCKGNKGVYEAFHLENLFSLDSVLDLTAVTTEINKIVSEGSQASLDNINIIPDDLKNLLGNFSTSGVDGINFTQYDAVLNIDLVSNLSGIITELNNTANTIQAQKPAEAQKLKTEMDKLISIESNELKQISIARQNLSAALVHLRNQTDLKQEVERLVSNLTASQNTFNTKSHDILNKSLNATSEKLLSNVTNGVNKVKKDIRQAGKCLPVYNSVQLLSDAFCKTTLDPLNSIWFGLGWGLCFIIPGIVFALLTASLYQREEKYDEGFHATRKLLKKRSKEESTFDNPDIEMYQGQGYDAYNGQGADNIPLTGARNNQPGNRNSHSGGMSNQGYNSPEHRGSGYPGPEHRNGSYPSDYHHGYPEFSPSAPPPYNGHSYNDRVSGRAQAYYKPDY